MSNHAEEQAIIETILNYVNEDKTQREPEILRAPTTDYTSERVLDAVSYTHLRAHET